MVNLQCFVESCMKGKKTAKVHHYSFVFSFPPRPPRSFFSVLVLFSLLLLLLVTVVHCLCLLFVHVSHPWGWGGGGGGGGAYNAKRDTLCNEYSHFVSPTSLVILLPYQKQKTEEE